MPDTQVALGQSMKITGVSTTKPAGYLHQIGGFVGVVLNDIIGTGVAYVATAALGAGLTEGFGDGKGDMSIQGIYSSMLHSGIVVAVGDALYYDGTNHDRVNVTNTGHFVGHVWPQDDGGATRAIDTERDHLWMQLMSPTYKVVNFRLLQHPKTGLV